MNAHSHTECRSLLGSLSEYVDGELGADLCIQIEQHMQDCENCRVVVDTLRKTVSLYHQTAAGEADVPADVKERLFKVLHLEEYLQK